MKRIVLGLMLAAWAGSVAAEGYARPFAWGDSTYTERNWKNESNRFRFDGYGSENNPSVFTRQEPGYERDEFSNPQVYPNLLRKKWGRLTP
jgi:hypothetical protein